MDIKFIIITVCLNSGEGLYNTVLSVIQQNYKNWEMIIKDGGSIDGSIDSIPFHHNIRVFVGQDAGIYSAMNFALQKVYNGYVCFLNAGDCFVSNRVLEDVALQIWKMGERDVYYGNYCNALEDECTMPQSLSKRFLYHSFLCHQAIFYRKEILGKFDESFFILADHKKHLELLESGKTFCHLPMILCFYEGGGISENPEYKALYKKELRRLHGIYFSFAERAYYWLCWKITLPRLRLYIASGKSPDVFRKIYRKIVNFIRCNKENEKNEK